MVCFDDAQRTVALLHGVQQVPQEVLVRQIIISAVGGDDHAARSHLDGEEGQPYVFARLVGQPHLEGVGGDILHHGDAFLLQVGAGKVKHQPEDDRQQQRSHGHIDEDEFQTQLSDHGVASR